MRFDIPAEKDPLKEMFRESIEAGGDGGSEMDQTISDAELELRQRMCQAVATLKLWWFYAASRQEYPSAEEIDNLADYLAGQEPTDGN